ncbi:unnamed protein product, partial [Adineta steineri]
PNGGADGCCCGNCPGPPGPPVSKQKAFGGRPGGGGTGCGGGQLSSIASYGGGTSFGGAPFGNPGLAGYGGSPFGGGFS